MRKNGSIRLLNQGFTLVEIMIVVAILGVLAAIAIPNMLRARMNANEGAIKYDLKTFSSANENYRSSQMTPAYADTVNDLVTSTPAYIDSTWSENPKHGFNLTYTPGDNTFAMLAVKNSAFDSSNDYCVDQSAAITKASDGLTGAATGCSGGTPIA